MKKSTFKKRDKQAWEAFLKGKIIDDYSHLTEDHIASIWYDPNALPHWQKIIEMIYEVDTKVLEFILQMKVPFNGLIQYELDMRKRDIEIQKKKFKGE